MQTSFTLSLLLAFALTILTAEAKPTIIIDPGHGGKDPGGLYGNYYEKTYALRTALELERRLKQMGYRTVMTRRSDIFLSLPQRTQRANRYGANAIFVSIHFNAHRSSRPHGIETYYASSRGRQLAKSTQKATSRRVHIRDRGTRKANFYVLLNTTMPAILFEGGFLSNSSDRSLILTSAYRSNLARGLSEGIHAFAKTY